MEGAGILECVRTMVCSGKYAPVVVGNLRCKGGMGREVLEELH